MLLVTLKRHNYRNSLVDKIFQNKGTRRKKIKVAMKLWLGPIASFSRRGNCKPSGNLPPTSTKVNTKVLTCAAEEESPFRKWQVDLSIWQPRLLNPHRNLHNVSQEFPILQWLLPLLLPHWFGLKGGKSSPYSSYWNLNFLFVSKGQLKQLNKTFQRLEERERNLDNPIYKGWHAVLNWPTWFHFSYRLLSITHPWTHT